MAGSAERPRLSVFRSHQHVFAQLINDAASRTIIALADRGLKGKSPEKSEKNYTQKEKIAYELGFLLAKKAKEKKIERAVFDRGGYKYHGRVKAIAEGARAGGLKF